MSFLASDGQPAFAPVQIRVTPIADRVDRLECSADHLPAPSLDRLGYPDISGLLLS
jgi:hypothetical protein